MSEQDDLLKSLTIAKDERSSSGDTGSGRRTAIGGAIVFALLLVFGGAWFGGFFEGSDPQTPDRTIAEAAPETVPDTTTTDVTASPPPRVSQVSAQRPSRDGVVLDASGYVTARRIATVSAELTGLIKTVLIEEGMDVEEGQVLATLDDALAAADYKVANARIRQVEAEVGTFRANLAEARRELARATALRKDNFASEARVTQGAANVEALEANLAGAEARVEVSRFEAQRLKERLDDHTIRAPFAGVVTVKAAQPGEIVSPVSAGGGFTRTGICTIVDMASLEIEVDINEAFIGRVFDGQRVVANLDAYPDWDIDAYVIAIIPTANREKATVRVRIGINNRDKRILPDMGIRVALFGADQS